MFVESDATGRVTLPGHPSTTYMMVTQGDGSVVLQPVSGPVAQEEYDSSPALQAALREAMTSRTVRRRR